jgi:hypothetical protein
MENEQLRREAAMKRIPVSQAVEDIKVTTLTTILKNHFGTMISINSCFQNRSKAF